MLMWQILQKSAVYLYIQQMWSNLGIHLEPCFLAPDEYALPLAIFLGLICFFYLFFFRINTPTMFISKSAVWNRAGSVQRDFWME